MTTNAALDSRISIDLLRLIDELSPGDKTDNGFYVVDDEYVGSTRWYAEPARWFEIWYRVFSDGEGNFWGYDRQITATGLQEDSQQELTLTSVKRLKPKQVTITTYVPFDQEV